MRGEEGYPDIGCLVAVAVTALWIYGLAVILKMLI